MSEQLRRLLGPGRPELTCEECFAELDWYVDRQLAGVDVRSEGCSACRTPNDCRVARDCLGMRAHLAGCPACSEDYSSLLALASESS
jgi:hypothetical protein